MKSLRQVDRFDGWHGMTLVPMIEWWTPEDVYELEARCARFRIAKLALDRGPTEMDRAEMGREDEADPAA